MVDKKRPRRVYIGKWQKSWGQQLLADPDPDPDPEDRGLGRGSGRNRRKRKRGVRLFVGSEEPLLSSRKRAPNNKRAQKNSKRGLRGRKRKGLELEASSLPPLSQSSSIEVHDEGDANQNAALYEEDDPDADVDIDKGVWPGEYGLTHAHDGQYMTFVPPDITVSGVVATTISPEELERAIGAALAASMQF